MRANEIDTGFIERELKNLTESSAEAGDLELCAAVAAIVEQEQKAARSESAFALADLWLDAGRPAAAGVLVPCRGRAPSRRSTLQYGNGPSTVTVDDREFVFAFVAH